MGSDGRQGLQAVCLAVCFNVRRLRLSRPTTAPSLTLRRFSQRRLEIICAWIGVIDEDDCNKVNTGLVWRHSKKAPGTMFRNIKPDTILPKRILIRIKPLKILVLGIIHRSVLLMAEDDSLARATFSRPFAALRTFGLLFITLIQEKRISSAVTRQMHKAYI